MSANELVLQVEERAERLDDLESSLRRALDAGKKSKKYADIAKKAKIGFFQRGKTIEYLC